MTSSLIGRVVHVIRDGVTSLRGFVDAVANGNVVTFTRGDGTTQSITVGTSTTPLVPEPNKGVASLRFTEATRTLALTLQDGTSLSAVIPESTSGFLQPAVTNLELPDVTSPITTIATLEGDIAITFHLSLAQNLAALQLEANGVNVGAVSFASGDGIVSATVNISPSEWTAITAVSATSIAFQLTGTDTDSPAGNVTSNTVTISVQDASGAEPAITSLSIDNQNLIVDPDTLISGSKTFRWTIDNPENVTAAGLTLQQSGGNLATGISPTALEHTVDVVNANLQAGDTLRFTLSGVSALTGGATFSREVIITARQEQDFIYYGADADGVLTDFPASAERTPFVAGGQTITVPNFTGNQHLVIAQRASDPAITSLLIDSLDQLSAFTLQTDAFTVSGVSYNALVSNQLLIGTIFSGKTVTIGR